jgi:hypothetical protein
MIAHRSRSIMESICMGNELTEDDLMFLVALSRAFNKISLPITEESPVSDPTSARGGPNG